MKPTMNEIIQMLTVRVSEIEKAKAPDMPEDIAAYRCWQGELNGLAVRLGALAADAGSDLTCGNTD